MTYLLLTFMLLNLSLISCQPACNSFKTCGECMSFATEKCVWCLHENVKGRRCQPESYLHSEAGADWCKTENIYNPIPQKSNLQDSDYNDTIQLRPQSIHFKARPGVAVDFTIHFRPANNFPLDVYFLMDYSRTMKDHQKELEAQVSVIYEELKKLTNNVRLGLGSFQEKPGMPYGGKYNHAFKNELSLTDNMTNFEIVVKKDDSDFRGNYDDLEASLDALMQVMACGNELGWRSNTRRIIVLATDSGYHSAGDGKMIGAFKPNDMKCHLKDGVYDPDIAVSHDYPSVGQIDKMASDGNFQIIFAALKKVQSEYEALASQVLGAKYAELKEQSNIMQIIRDAYQESVRRVELTSNPPSSIKLTINQDCQAIPPVNCESKPNTILTIPASIKSLDCPIGTTEHIIEMHPLGLSDKLRIKFTVDCQCECEKSDDVTPSGECNFQGIKKCGACKCNDDRSGEYCQFNCTELEAMKNMNQCYQHSEAAKPCNGHGNCRCGRCEDCAPGFSGEFCQYDDTSCPRTANGKLCAGNGVCKYGECQCDTQWTGVDCNCPKDTTECIGPFSSKPCSGRGECKCGECICDNVGSTSEKYTGMYCDMCDDCAIQRCQDFKDYAYCAFLKPKEECDQLFNSTAEVYLVNATEFDNATTWSMATKCRTALDDGTFLLFKYQAVPGTRTVQLCVRNEVEQPPKANIWIAVGGAIAGILLIGLLTVIIWKIAVTVYDKREYDKFCKEAQAQGFSVSENILYEPPNLNFINPTYNNRDL